MTHVPVTTCYVWDGDTLLAEYDGSGDRAVGYAYAGGFAPLQVAYPNGSGEDVYDVHTDHLDTPRMLTDATGAVAWRASYEAFGDASLDAGNSVTFNVRFPGQYFDAESGMHYNRHRYYPPELGRYISADPIGQAGGVNVYRYADASPVHSRLPSRKGIGMCCAGSSAGSNPLRCESRRVGQHIVLSRRSRERSSALAATWSRATRCNVGHASASRATVQPGSHSSARGGI